MDDYYESNITRWILSETNVKSCTRDQKKNHTNWTRISLEEHDLIAVYAIKSNRVWSLLTFQCEQAQLGCLNVVLKITLHNLVHWPLFHFTRDFDKLKINSEVYVRDGEEDIQIHVMRHSWRKQESLVLKILALFRQWEQSRKEEKKSRIECLMWHESI